ncbi:cold-inducible protein YdjO-related protein [Paenibacillus aurantiacus]|uniref:Cold-inducible protein YdjO-related protein n=1 Tax=Paenibacillus aurantiacus TaxID=1936118 RepID=A0ABV5KRX1_9BACL
MRIRQDHGGVSTMNHRNSKQARYTVETPLFETEVWECMDTNCRSWMRKNMSLLLEPHCPVCHSGMQENIRMLPQVVHVAK